MFGLLSVILMMSPTPRDSRRTCLIVLCGLGMFSGLTSCANLEEHEKQEEALERQEAKIEKQELKDSLEVRNEVYTNIQDRRRMRKYAREERYQAWYDRIMH